MYVQQRALLDKWPVLNTTQTAINLSNDLYNLSDVQFNR